MQINDVVPDNSIAVEYFESEQKYLVAEVLATGVNIPKEQFSIGDKVHFLQEHAFTLALKTAIIISADKASKFEFEPLEVALWANNENEYVIVLEPVIEDNQKAYNVKQYRWPFRKYTLPEDTLVELDTNLEMRLITYEFNYGDEFDVNGFELLNAADYDLYRNIVRLYFSKPNNVPFEMSFGSNESIKLTLADLNSILLGFPISLSTASIIKHSIGKSAGVSNILTDTVEQIREELIDYVEFNLKQSVSFSHKKDMLDWMKENINSM